MGNYIIGGWTQNPADKAPSTFSRTMYGMITNLEGLTSGTPEYPGWSPVQNPAPPAQGQVLWTYGGAGCTPTQMPGTPEQIKEVVAATRSNKWAGVDFDDECQMDVDNIIATMKALKPNLTSYTFLAGWDYNNPHSSIHGKDINHAVSAIAQSGAADLQILMCYGGAMWSMTDIIANVGPAIDRTLANGVPAKEVILALTPAGLNPENLDYFLNQVTDKGIGGLFIWNFPDLHYSDLEEIERRLDID